MTEVRSAGDVDARALVEHVVSTWGAEFVVAHDEAMYPARLAGFVAVSGEEIVGHVSYRVESGRCEVVSIDASPPRVGTGTLLMEAVVEAAWTAGCTAVWLTTTNDNLDALRFYQRRGFRLIALRPGGFDRVRHLKPDLPPVGSYGIPRRDELDLELELLGDPESTREAQTA